MRRYIIALVVFALAGVAAQEASAQPTPRQTDPPKRPDRDRPSGRPSQRPYRGIFGGGQGDTAQSLTLGLSLGGGFDSSVLLDSPTTTGSGTETGTGGEPSGEPPTDVAPPTEPTSDFRRGHASYGQASANIDYTLGREWIDFSASAGTSGSYYPVASQSFTGWHFAKVGSSVRIGTRASLMADYGVSYQPVQHLGTLPGGVDSSLGPIDPFEGVRGTRSEAYRSDAAEIRGNYQLTRRLTLTSGYGRWQSRSRNRDRDFGTEQASVHTSFSLLRDLGMYVGYRLTWSDFSAVEDLPGYRSHNLDIGLSFSKALSLTRRTSLSFGTGTASVTDGNRTSTNLTGNARLSREIARTWSASLAYARDAQFVRTFRQPVFTDSVYTTFGGLVSPRVRFDAGAGVVFGSVGFNSNGNGYDAFFSSAGLGVAMTRNLSCGARYMFSRYTFDSNIELPADLLFQTNRHGVNVYLSTWLPLYTRTRRR